MLLAKSLHPQIFCVLFRREKASAQGNSRPPRHRLFREEDESVLSNLMKGCQVAVASVQLQVLLALG